MVPQYKADYPTVIDAMRLSAMFSVARTEKMRHRRSTRRNTDTGAWEGH